jgi:undecaprenyl-diphosphatase
MRDAFVLGAVQGVAEWLPVSSSGHLVVFRHLFGLEGGVSFDIFLHLSALFVIFIFFWQDIIRVGRAFFSFDRKSYEFKVSLYIIYATVVTGVAGILLKPYIERLATLEVMPLTFLITSVFLFYSYRNSNGEMDAKKAVFIGLIQGMALLPGVSRSGSTISAGKIAGVKNEESFRFSFLIAIPAIAGAIVYNIKDFKVLPVPFLLAGFVTSLILGLCSLYILKKVFLSGRLYLFGFYTIALSILLFVIR